MACYHTQRAVRILLEIDTRSGDFAGSHREDIISRLSPYPATSLLFCIASVHPFSFKGERYTNGDSPGKMRGKNMSSQRKKICELI